eukprot:6173758-Pleurochrysis_carterae.AAC.1
MQVKLPPSHTNADVYGHLVGEVQHHCKITTFSFHWFQLISSRLQVRSSPSGTMPHHMLDAVAGQPMKTRVRPNFKLPRQQSHPFRQQPMYAQQLAPERGSEDGKVGDGGDRPETIDKEGESIAQCVDGGSDGSKECGNGGCGGGGGGGGGDGSDGSDGGGGCGQEKGGGGAGGQASRGRCPSSAAEAWITAAPSRRAAPATTATRTQRSPKRPPPFIAHDKAPGHVFSRTVRTQLSTAFSDTTHINQQKMRIPSDGKGYDCVLACSNLFSGAQSCVTCETPRNCGFTAAKACSTE